MPVVGVNRDALFRALGEVFTQEQFEELCFEYGIELDDVTSEREIMRKEQSSASNLQLAEASDDVIYKIDIPANRYDMLCIEGISRALNIFRGKIPAPKYRIANLAAGTGMTKVYVRPETALVRPFIVCAILRGVTFTKERYDSFIDLQDKLHQNLCRQRSLVAIGTHDLSTVKGPFTYEALPPTDIEFIPLKQQKKYNAKDLLDYYLSNDQKLKRYVPLIQSSFVYPVVMDSERNVLSLPPIINGAKSAITLNTKYIFIECTATDLTKAKIVLNTVCAMFSEYCSTPFEIEPVEVIDSRGSSTIYPDLAMKKFDVKIDYVNMCTGLKLMPGCAIDLLKKMQLEAEAKDNSSLTVRVPITRSDVLHSCDIMEDVAISYGYNNLPIELPMTSTVGKENPLAQICELLRVECATSGFTEVLTWALCSRKEIFDDLRLDEQENKAVSIGNPATVEFEVCRTTLLPGVLKTLGSNKDTPLPLKLFEVSDVVMIDEDKDVGARNERRIVAVNCDKASGFEVIHGLVNRIMQVLGVPHQSFASSRQELTTLKKGISYSWKPDSSNTYFDGRYASLHAMGSKVGEFGVVHPEVLQAFDIPYPVAALELNIEPFVFDQNHLQLRTHM